MSSPIVIHVVRPYASEDEYLAQEAWTIDARGMLLIDQEPLPADTALVFDVQIQGGHKPIRAEAKVIGMLAASGGRPGGLRVRFKRFGTATKAFIDRAVAARQAASGAPAVASASLAPRASLTPSASVAPSLSRAPLPAEPSRSEPQASLSLPELARSEPRTHAALPDRGEPSGIHRRIAAPVPPPVNREELLEKLRTRARSLAKAGASTPGSEQTG